jgi:hypothetical protein
VRPDSRLGCGVVGIALARVVVIGQDLLDGRVISLTDLDIISIGKGSIPFAAESYLSV